MRWNGAWASALMRDYGRIYTKFWTSTDIRALSDDGRLLALYLLSGPHGTIAGVCRLPDGYIADDLTWVSPRVAQGLAELAKKGFANRCETTKWLWIRKFFTWNRPENPNQWKSARNIAESVPADCVWRTEFYKVFALSGGGEITPPANPSPTLLEPLPTQEQEQEQEQEKDKTRSNGHAKANGNGHPVELEANSTSPVEKVFDHWRHTWQKPKAKLDPKRTKVIRSALKTYPPEILCESIEGYRKSEFHMGKNDTRTVYDDIEIMLRDAKHIERGLQFAQGRSAGVQWD